MKCHHITANTLDEAHHLATKTILDHGHEYVITHGSFIGHTRLELPFVSIRIIHPGTRPLAPTMPLGVPPPTDDDSIINYCAQYLLSGDVQPNEQYTYGHYISKQLDVIIDMLTANKDATNQATITIGGIESVSQEHPPCLRLIDCRIENNRLCFVVYFRSWDCWGGMPENLGGLQILKEYMSEMIGVDDGEIIAVSKGLHLYDFQFEYAKQRLHMT